jgi:hypothetical protein
MQTEISGDSEKWIKFAEAHLATFNLKGSQDLGGHGGTYLMTVKLVFYLKKFSTLSQIQPCQELNTFY